MSKKEKQSKDCLGDRMKGYEANTRTKLMLGTPHIIRLDMRAGHTFCRGLDKPFDRIFCESMEYTAKMLCEQVQGCTLAYTQSDEITMVLLDGFTNEYSCFFDGVIQKITSITASIATLAFNQRFIELTSKISDSDVRKRYAEKAMKATFDSRVFSVPTISEAYNCIVWRVLDCIRNSVSAMGQATFTTKELYKKNMSSVREMLRETGTPWETSESLRNRFGTFFWKVEKHGENDAIRHAWERHDVDFSDGGYYDTLKNTFPMEVPHPPAKKES